MISEVLRPDPDILALTARPQLLARAFGSKWDERGRTHTVASTVDRREARGTHDRRESYIRDSQSKPKQLVKKKKRNPTHPPPPLGKTRSAIGPRGCHSRALTLEKAHGCGRSPHTPAGEAPTRPRAVGRWRREAAVCPRPKPRSIRRAPPRPYLLSLGPRSPRPAASRRRAAAYLPAALTADSIQGRASSSRDR